MKISNIKLINFRNHQDSDLVLDRLNIICGPNASGKSSIKQALEVALTGRCETTDRGGRGLDDLIRVGEKKAVVAVGIESLGEVVRAISPSGSKLQVAGWTGSMNKVQQELLYREIGADADLITAVVNVSGFISLPPKEQAEMLFRVLAPRPDTEDALAGLDEMQREVLADVVGDLIGGLGPEQCEAIYKQLYEARRESKKELERARGRLAGLEASAIAGAHDPALLPEMRRQLAELEQRKSELEAEKAKAAGAGERRQFLEKKIENITAKVKELTDQLTKRGEAPDVAAIREQLGGVTAEMNKANEESAGLVGEIRGLDDAVGALKKAGGKCPLAPEVIACPLKGDELQALTKDLDARRKKVVKAHEAAQKKVTALGVKAKDLTSVIADEEERAGLEATLADTQEILAALEAELRENMAGNCHPADVDAELADLTSRIHRGHTMIAQTELAEQNRQGREEAEVAGARLEARVEALERLTIFFGPGADGIRSQHLSSSLADARERINKNLEEITAGRYQVEIRTEPEFHVVVHGPAGVVELRQLSFSERMRVGIAISEALAYLSGLRLLIIDDAEILDYENRALLSRFLLDLREYDTVILLSTAEEAKDLGISGVATFWVEDGKVERVGEKVRT